MGDDIEELGCLAKNIYFEAKSQSNAGQISVALVVMNRVKDSRFLIQYAKSFIKDL
nr:MAG: hypothetical protein CM15mV30_2010 [uncultured marine virus]